MITEDFVSFEIAKLLKEKGFDERGLCVYIIENKSLQVFGDWVENSCLFDHLIAAPTLQMARKWLREKFGIHFRTSPVMNENKEIGYECKIYKFFPLPINHWFMPETYKTYEEAVEASLRYALENLIQ